jgi:exodeoxyribonuclease V alpha subunit
VRVHAGISYALTKAMDEGHCGLPTEELIPLAEKLEVLQELIRTALDLELHEGAVVADRVGETPCVFLAGLHRAERTIAERLMRLADGTLPWPRIDPDKALRWGRSVSTLPSLKARLPRFSLHWCPRCWS